MSVSIEKEGSGFMNEIHYDQWLRSNRRVPGSDPDGNERKPGPWHLNSDQHGYIHTFCGKQFGNVFYVQKHKGDQPEGDVCGVCLKQHDLGFAKAYRS